MQVWKYLIANLYEERECEVFIHLYQVNSLLKALNIHTKKINLIAFLQKMTKFICRNNLHNNIRENKE